MASKKEYYVTFEYKFRKGDRYTFVERSSFLMRYLSKVTIKNS